MPYVITTRQPWYHADGEFAGDTIDRRAVATLEEAHAAIRNFCDETFAYYGRYHADANAIPEAGGTVGPLPDGTIIEVAPFDRARLLTVTSGDIRQTDAELCNAFNARQES